MFNKKIVQVKRADISPKLRHKTLTDIHDELGKLVLEFTRRDNDKNKFLKNKSISMLMVLKHLLERPNNEIVMLESKIK